MNAIDFYIFWTFFGAVIPPRFQAIWTLFLLHLVSFLWCQPAPCLQQLYPSFFSPALSHPLHYSSPPPPTPVPSVYPLRHYPPPLPSPPSSNLPMRYSRDQLLEIQPSTPNFELVNRLRELRLGVGLPRKRGCRGGRKKLRSIQVVPSRNLHPVMVPPFLQPHPDLQSAVGNAPLSSKHPTQLPTTDCLFSIIPLMGGQPSDAPALSPPSPLQQGGQSSNAPALSPPSPLPQGGQPIALALSPSSPPPQDGQPSDAPGLSPSSSTLLLCPSDSTLSICHLNSQSAVKTDVFHWLCLHNHCRQLPATTAPAGYTCPSCSTCIFPLAKLATPVAQAVRHRLQQVNWARAGLGLPMIDEDQLPPPPVRLESHKSSNESSVKTSAAPADSQGSPLPANTTLNTVVGFHSIFNTDDTRQWTNPRKWFDSTKDDGLFPQRLDHDDNKYRRRPAFQWLADWFRSSKGSGRGGESSGRRRASMFLILSLLAFLTITLVLSQLSHLAADDDPFLDPMNNPNIKVEQKLMEID
ncbi:hypothetical protein ACOMHN_033137 [Nucella lapillus]